MQNRHLNLFIFIKNCASFCALYPDFLRFNQQVKLCIQANCNYILTAVCLSLFSRCLRICPGWQEKGRWPLMWLSLTSAALRSHQMGQVTHINSFTKECDIHSVIIAILLRFCKLFSDYYVFPATLKLCFSPCLSHWFVRGSSHCPRQSPGASRVPAADLRPA